MDAKPVYLEQCIVGTHSAQLVTQIEDGVVGYALHAAVVPFLISEEECAVLMLKLPSGQLTLPGLQVLSTELPWRTAAAALASVPGVNEERVAPVELLRSGLDVTYLTGDELHSFRSRVCVHDKERVVDMLYPTRIVVKGLEALEAHPNLVLLPWRGTGSRLEQEFASHFSARTVRNLALGTRPLPEGWETVQGPRRP